MEELIESGDYITGALGQFGMETVRIMAVEANAEFAVVNAGGTEYLITGNETGTNIPEDILVKIKNERETVAFHVHPFVGDVWPSEADMKIFDALTWQETSRIISVDGIISTFNKNGLISKKSNKW